MAFARYAAWERMRTAIARRPSRTITETSLGPHGRLHRTCVKALTRPACGLLGPCGVVGSLGLPVMRLHWASMQRSGMLAQPAALPRHAAFACTYAGYHVHDLRPGQYKSQSYAHNNQTTKAAGGASATAT